MTSMAGSNGGKCSRSMSPINSGRSIYRGDHGMCRPAAGHHDDQMQVLRRHLRAFIIVSHLFRTFPELKKHNTADGNITCARALLRAQQTQQCINCRYHWHFLKLQTDLDELGHLAVLPEGCNIQQAILLTPGVILLPSARPIWTHSECDLAYTHNPAVERAHSA